MGKNGIYAYDRVFPPWDKCIKCNHKMFVHNKHQCQAKDCMCIVKNPTFKFILQNHIATVAMLTGSGYRTRK